MFRLSGEDFGGYFDRFRTSVFRYELAGYAESAAAGEEILTADRAESPDLAGLWAAARHRAFLLGQPQHLPGRREGIIEESPAGRAC